MLQVSFMKLDERAKEPRNAYGDDAGWDLFCIEDAKIEAGAGRDLRTGLAVAIPNGYFGRIVARSSTMRKRGLMVLEGIIDSGFRGELFSYCYVPAPYLLVGPREVMIKAGESVAQLIVQPVPGVQFKESKVLPGSARGQSGFGSSGS
jgi:dUTP pyrophosphatase